MDAAAQFARRQPDLSALIRLTKPITWFPPMWAYLCGVVSVGGSGTAGVGLVILGLVLAGPIVCGMSQVANDWCDRHVDAINEPDRPIPSGRVSPGLALGLALAMSALAALVGWQLGPWGFGATLVAIVAAWAYSAEPVRLKRSGWWGPGLVGLCYEGLPWFTGAAVVAAGAPPGPVVTVALLYALGAQGIMTLNDFKALRGDVETGVRSLPVTLGPARAVRVACWVMAVPQVVVMVLLASWGQTLHAVAIAALIGAQILAMRVLLRDPEGRAPWYNGTGVLAYITGMMVAAHGLRGIGL